MVRTVRMVLSTLTTYVVLKGDAFAVVVSVYVCTYMRSCVVSKVKMDYSEYIPVLCQTEGSFHGKSYWEKISSVVRHNGKSIDRSMTKSDFTEGDEVVVHFNGQGFRSIVKHSDYLITTRSQSPSPEPPAPVQKSEVEVATSTGVPTTSSAGTKQLTRTTPKKRRCAVRKKSLFVYLP